MGMCGQAGLRRDNGYGCGQLVNVRLIASVAGFAGINGSRISARLYDRQKTAAQQSHTCAVCRLDQTPCSPHIAYTRGARTA